MESLDGLDLSGDFDPEQWDRQMSAIFNSDYYAQPDETMRAEMEAGEGDGDWDGEGEEWTEEGGEGEDVSGKRKRGGRRAKRGGGLEAAAAAEGSGNVAAAAAELRKTTQEVMDEYYGLDYEDVIGQGESAIATRFKYRKVEPTSFGVSVAVILAKATPVPLSAIAFACTPTPIRRYCGIFLAPSERAPGPIVGPGDGGLVAPRPLQGCKSISHACVQRSSRTRVARSCLERMRQPVRPVVPIFIITLRTPATHIASNRARPSRTSGSPEKTAVPPGAPHAHRPCKYCTWQGYPPSKSHVCPPCGKAKSFLAGPCGVGK